jgi:hypothetical protein
MGKALDGQVAIITGGARGQGQARWRWLASGRASCSDEAWQEMIGTNLTGVFNAMRAVVPHINERTVERDANGEPLSDEILGKRFAAHHPIPRPWVYPEDVAREVVHLVTEPGNITGAVIEIGLGQSARMH